MKFFENAKEKLENMQPEKIFNFDETNLTDDPGAKKVVVLRGTKRVERVMEHSKVAISLMFCISASDDILPPFVVYKAENLYGYWCNGGPAGFRYNVKKTGWFDSRTFELWFRHIFLPHVENIPGEKVELQIILPLILHLLLYHCAEKTTITLPLFPQIQLT